VVGGTKEMAEQARRFAEARAAAGAPSTFSSAEFMSCSNLPMIEDDDLDEHLSRTPLHITLGLGTNYVNLIEAECIKLDFDWAMYSENNANLWDYQDALQEAEVNIAIAKGFDEEAESKREGMAIALQFDSKADRRGKVNPELDSHQWVIQYRKLREEAKKAEESAKKARAKVDAAEKRGEASRAELMCDAGGIGPFQKRFDDFLSKLGISRQKYFGGTFIGPDLHAIFGTSENIRALCDVLQSHSVMCPDGVEREFGSAARVRELSSVLLPFGELHKLFNRKEPLCEHEISRFPTLVTEHAIAFAIVFPTTVPTPKMHVLCYHMEEMLARHGSVGMDTEQGIESFHPEVTYIRNMFRNMDKQPERQLAKVAETCWARCGGKRVRGTEGLKESKHARAERGREKHKSK
jgi:hypothetical protein